MSPTCCSSDCSTERRYAGLAVAAQLFHALADETRLAIVQQLREQGEVCACDFQACCALAQPTVSHHLKVLREAGLVRAVKRGVWVHYSLGEKAFEMVRRWLPETRQEAEGPLLAEARDPSGVPSG